MKRIILLLAALALALTAAPVSAENITADWMTRQFKTRDVIGGAVIISRYGETVFSMTYGSKSAHVYDPVTLDTCFRIASVTKMVSAVGLMRLYDQGYFNLDAPLGEVLPFQVLNSAYPDSPPTVRQALSHTTGLLQTQTTQINWAYVSQRNTEKFFKPYTRPGTFYIYSNANGAFYGALIEALTGQSVNTYMAQNVFAPLSVNAAYTTSLLPDASDVSNRMSKTGGNLMSRSRAMEEEYEDTCNPARHLTPTVGNLHISANGLNRIGMMLCNEGYLDGVRILSPYTVRLMQADQRDFPDSSVSAESPYGLSMQRVTDCYGNVWYGHQGMKEGLSSDLFYLPEQGLVVTVIANGYTALKSGALVSIAIRTMERAVETDWDHYGVLPEEPSPETTPVPGTEPDQTPDPDEDEGDEEPLPEWDFIF